MKREYEDVLMKRKRTQVIRPQSARQPAPFKNSEFALPHCSIFRLIAFATS